MSWQTAPLSALGSVGRGKSRHRPRNDPSLYGGKYPFFQTGDVTAAEFYLSAFSQTYNEKGLAQSKIWDPSTLCITIAANIAETAILKIPGCFPDSIVGFCADRSKSDVRFVKYALDVSKRDFQTISKGTTQDNLSVEKLLSIKLPAPPTEIQRRIADILSAYDDLIENNTQRIAILEDMARRLFEAWFIRSDERGNAEPVRIDALIDFDPRTKVSKEGRKPFLPMPSVPTNSMVVSNWEEREGNSGSKFLNGDTLLARITPCLENGKTAFVDFLPGGTAGFGSTEFIVMRGRSVPPEFVYCLARSNAFREHAIQSMSGATGRQRVSCAAVAQFEIASPHRELLNQFGDAARPMFAMVRSLAYASSNLRTTRDLLLPKLISGEIEVRAAEEVLKTEAA